MSQYAPPARVRALVLYNGYQRHLGDTAFRRMLFEVLERYGTGVLIAVPSREVADHMQTEVLKHVHARFRYDYSVTRWASHILARYGPSVRGCFFDHESKKRPQTSQSSRDLWETYADD